MVKHFIDIENFNKETLLEILSIANSIKNSPANHSEKLKNKSLGMIFEKQSTRTRVSFDIGMKKLGGEVIEMDTDSIGFGERESNIDIVKVLSQYLDCLVLRNNDHEIIKQLADINSIPIINGLSNYSHPCQILSDIFTIEEKKGPITNLVISWSGDINNVLISLAQASKILDFRLNVACPEKILNQKKHFLENFNENIVFFQNPMEAVKDSDCIMTDVWCSMGDKSNDLELFRDFQINKNVMNASKQDSIFMHCLPAKRNQEVTDEVIDSERSIVWKQAYNRMLVQQGILSYCIE